jgi:hypothetical protein
VVANGGCVREKSYSRSYAKIAGYGRPDYSQANQAAVQTATNTKKEDDTMTGEEIYKALQNYLAEQPLPDWAKAEMQEAKDLGITDGSNPMQLIPRYQAAIMAKRAVKK